MKVKNGDRVKGTCLCHGVKITGIAGTTAQPAEFLSQDFWDGSSAPCWAVKEVLEDGTAGRSHDIPTQLLHRA